MRALSVAVMAVIPSLSKIARHEAPRAEDDAVKIAEKVICMFILPEVPGGGRELPWLLIRDGVAAAWASCRSLNQARQGCSSRLCWGRVWGEGAGGQCTAVRRVGEVVCAKHEKNKKHGLVVNVPPENPFRLHRRCAANRRQEAVATPAAAEVRRSAQQWAPMIAAVDLSLSDAELEERYGLRSIGVVLGNDEASDECDAGSVHDDDALSNMSGDEVVFDGDTVEVPEDEANLEEEDCFLDEDRLEEAAAASAVDEAEAEEDAAWASEMDEAWSDFWDKGDAAAENELDCIQGVEDERSLNGDDEPEDLAAGSRVKQEEGKSARRCGTRRKQPQAMPSRTAAAAAGIQGYLQAARAAPPTANSKEMKLLGEYAAFSEEVLLDGQMHSVVSTPVGDVSQEEGTLRAFLVKLRFGGGPVDGLYVLKAKTVENRLVLLKKGLRECVYEAGKLPAWATSGCRTSRTLDKLFQQWRKTEVQMEKAAKKRGFITDDMVERYCLDLVVKDRVEGRLPMAAVFAGLLLRLQSARSIRHVNLASLRWRDVSWPAVARDRAAVAAIDVVVTKVIGNMSVRRAVSSKLKSRLLATDVLSAWFFSRWCEDAEAASRRPDDFFFPFLKATGDYDFGVGMNNPQHCCITRAAAAHLQLVTTEEELVGYASNCVRRGCAADLGARLEAVVEDSNQSRGRGRKSRIDLDVYMPDDVVLRPGPFYEDAAGIESRFRQRMAEALGATKEDRLCPMCGYPSCDCFRCDAMRRGVKSCKSGHSCWLTRRLGRVPKGGVVEDEEQLAARAAKWAEHAVACDEIPKFHDGRYSWPTSTVKHEDAKK